jgi:hypothetical protein
MGVHGDVAAPPRLHCEQRLMLSRWSQILLGARGFAFSRFRRASAAWRRLGTFALSRETALARENADFSVLSRNETNGDVILTFDTCHNHTSEPNHIMAASCVLKLPVGTSI